MAVADVAFDPVLHRGFLDVGLDRGAIGDRLRRAPRLEPEAQGEHVRVRSDARVFEQVPGAAQIVAAFQDGVALVGQRSCRCQAALTPEMPAPRMTTSRCSVMRTNYQHTVEQVNTLSKLSTPCKVAGVTTAEPDACSARPPLRASFRGRPRAGDPGDCRAAVGGTLVRRYLGRRPGQGRRLIRGRRSTSISSPRKRCCCRCSSR